MASNRRLRRRCCERKVKHACVRDAERAIAALVRSRGHQGRLDVYRCRFCSSFHIGHGKQRR